eukprot:TRINITY_DN33449_c0_g1_i1.p1 TRINITY_DN33449_c0_g1~~TRINITY_DN33449_c0_g1_i1.p1  ORF type:complete len:330 (+),score=24.19 TRINITY_DN33449_c0_g1_i1:108-1097(+)
MASLEAVKSFVASSEPSQLAVVGLALVGIIVILRGLSFLLTGIWVLFLRPGKNLRRYGSWAIVTGCTDGIGKGFVKEFAKRKINVILVSRTQEKLQAVASEVEEKYKIQAKVVVADFSNPGPALENSYAQIQSLVDELEVGILVNNAGLSYPFAQYLHEVDDKLIADLINTNVQPVVRLSKIVIPGMLKRKRGAIVNIGSGVATVIPSDPLYSVYAGTKAFVDQFSRSLNVEYAAKGIDVQVQAPLFVATKMSKIRKATLTCPSADLYAKCGANWIGQEVRCTPYWAHGVMWGIIYRFPDNLFNSIRMGQNSDIRRRAMAKLAKQKQEQ